MKGQKPSFPFDGFIEAVENISANQRPGRPFWFSDKPEKHRLGRGWWDLSVASWQISLNSIHWLQRISIKCLSQSEARAVILVFFSFNGSQNTVEDVEILFPVKFCKMGGCREEVETMDGRLTTIVHLSLLLRCTKMANFGECKISLPDPNGERNCHETVTLVSKKF